MILLIGGTSETAPLAEALAAAGFRVLVSTATEVPLDVGKHPNISSRRGMLDMQGMTQLATERGVQAIVDASHPYSVAAHANAKKVALDLSIPCFRWARPPAAKDGDPVFFARTHEFAARTACSLGRPVFLTTGSRNIVPYALEADRDMLASSGSGASSSGIDSGLPKSRGAGKAHCAGPRPVFRRS